MKHIPIFQETEFVYVADLLNGTITHAQILKVFNAKKKGIRYYLSDQRTGDTFHVAEEDDCYYISLSEIEAQEAIKREKEKVAKHDSKDELQHNLYVSFLRGEFKLPETYVDHEERELYHKFIHTIKEEIKDEFHNFERAHKAAEERELLLSEDRKEDPYDMTAMCKLLQETLSDIAVFSTYHKTALCAERFYKALSEENPHKVETVKAFMQVLLSKLQEQSKKVKGLFTEKSEDSLLHRAAKKYLQ